MRTRVVAAVALAGGLLPWLSGPASAAPVDAHIVDDILTVDGTGGADSIVVRCANGHVEVNGSRPGSLERCDDLRRILVFAGDGDDRVELSGVTRARFPNVAAADVQAEAGDDVVVGTAWADHLGGGSGTDSLRGGIGADVFEPGADDGTVVGGRGIDRIAVAGNANWTITAGEVSRDGAAASTISMATVERVVIVAGPADTTFDASGARVAVTVAARRGDDTLIGGTGDDVLVAGAGTDDVAGGGGDDTLSGKGGPDDLRGGSGDDQLLGGGGDDRCAGGPGADSVVGC
jgi:hypothetical protein